jgi:hypothetical protein
MIFSWTWSLGEGDTKQEEIGGGQKEGKETNSKVWIKDVGEGRCPHSILERSRVWLGIFSGSYSFIQTIPIEVDDVTLNVQEFHFPQHECWKR